MVSLQRSTQGLPQNRAGLTRNLPPDISALGDAMGRLNMWQRLGVVASGLWIIAGGIWQRTSDVAQAQKVMSFTYRVCTEAASLKEDYNFSPCMTKATQDFELFLQGSW